MELIKLTAVRSICKEGIWKGYAETTFFKMDGSKFATIPAQSKQPKYGSKQIVLNCFHWSLNWLKS